MRWCARRSPRRWPEVRPAFRRSPTAPRLPDLPGQGIGLGVGVPLGTGRPFQQALGVLQPILQLLQVHPLPPVADFPGLQGRQGRGVGRNQVGRQLPLRQGPFLK